MKSRKLALPYAVWMSVFTLIPVILIFIFALQDKSGNFTLNNLMKVWEYKDSLFYSLKIAFISTAICLLLAYPLSYIISRAKEKHQNTIILLITIPMWMNFLLRLVGWQILLFDNGPIDNLLNFIGINVPLLYNDTAVILGMVYEFLPFMVMPIYTVMGKIDTSLIEAAQDLGSNGFKVFSKVILPLSIPGVISGITMVFVPAASTFLVTKYLGDSTLMIGDLIEREFTYGSQNTGAAISLCLMIIILIFIIIMNRFGDEEAVG